MTDKQTALKVFNKADNELFFARIRYEKARKNLLLNRCDETMKEYDLSIENLLSIKNIHDKALRNYINS